MDQDEYPCDDVLFSLVDLNANTISAAHLREVTALSMSRLPIIDVNPAMSQRLAGISRRLTKPDTLPYSIRYAPHTIFSLYVPPEGFQIPMGLLLKKRDHLSRLYAHSIPTEPTGNTSDLPKLFQVNTLLPPRSQLYRDSNLANHPTAGYIDAWPNSVQLKPWYTATGLAEIFQLDHHKNIWIILADRGANFTCWRTWANYMKRCTPESMFGVALR